MNENILIIGGYGTVGSTISAHLSDLFPNKIIVAGRNHNKAQKLAKELNNKIFPVKFDVLNETNDTILENVKLVIMCIDQENTNFIEKCIEKGIHYIDITANSTFFEQIENLHYKAILNNVSILLSVGLAPGISNLLAKNSMNKLSNTKNIDLFILLGLGEKHGDAAYRWTFDNIHNEYEILNKSKKEKIRSFSLAKKTNLEGKRTFYSFDFSDQHILAKTTDLEKVLTRFAFDSNFLTSTVGFLRKIGVTRIFKNKMIQNLMLFIFKNVKLGSNIFAVKAVATNANNEVYESILKGYNQSQITAYMTVISAQEFLNKPFKAGVSHIHEVISDIPEFLNKLKSFDDSITINL